MLLAFGFVSLGFFWFLFEGLCGFLAFVDSWIPLVSGAFVFQQFLTVCSILRCIKLF